MQNPFSDSHSSSLRAISSRPLAGLGVSGRTGQQQTELFIVHGGMDALGKNASFPSSQKGNRTPRAMDLQSIYS